MPERELNELLRGADWRFLLSNPERPRARDRGSGIDQRALRLITEDAGEGLPDLVLTGFPRRRAAAKAAQELPPGGEIACMWSFPRPAGAALARRRLETAGFESVRVYWPGPIPRRPPQFWLPADPEAARLWLLAERPTQGPGGTALRVLWHLVARAGLLAPACAIGRLPDGSSGVGTDPSTPDPVLLTGGKRSINKVVAVALDGGETGAVTKFARVPAAGEALDKEAATLERIEGEHTEMEGVPRLLSTGRRAGCRAITETAVGGEQVIGGLARDRAPDLCDEVGEWLLGLVGRGPQPPERWRKRLVDGPVTRLRRDFGAAAPGVAESCAEVLAGLGPLPAAAEHRDCSPWNVLRRPDGGLGLLDWESAEPDGLPLLDLVYFTTNVHLVLDGALETGEGRPTYARMLDAEGATGHAFAACLERYASRTGVSPRDIPRLRLLCWVVHARSDRHHLEMAAGGEPSLEELRGSMFLSLVQEELSRQGRTN